MSDKLPIDYARAESADVVRKKFRRRAERFVSTVLMMVIGCVWAYTMYRPICLICKPRGGGPLLVLDRGSIVASTMTASSMPNWTRIQLNFDSRLLGVLVQRHDDLPNDRWYVRIDYRTLFILAMIPWIITLIRMIRIRRRMHRLETEPRTE